MGPQGGTALVLEDEPTVCAVHVAALAREGLRADAAGDVQTASKLLSQRAYDLVLLDLTLPDRSGFGFLQEIRQRDQRTPILVVSAADTPEDRTTGLRLGADDYLVKPFSLGELAARVHALMRRAHIAVTPPTRELRFANVVLDITARELWVDDAQVSLRPKLFDLLAYLATNPRQAFSREKLLVEVWRSQTEWQGTATVTEHMHQLRQIIESDPVRPRHLVTVRGTGYRFDP